MNTADYIYILMLNLVILAQCIRLLLLQSKLAKLAQEIKTKEDEIRKMCAELTIAVFERDNAFTKTRRRN